MLLDEVLEWLDIRPDGVYVDATLGAGGHSAAIAQRMLSLGSQATTPAQPSGRLISLDRDAQALQLAQGRLKEFGNLVTLVHAPFSRIAEAVQGLGIATVDGVLADLGVSSMQLDQPVRGFSFREGGPLDMRMSTGELAEDMLTADEIVNQWSEKEVADLLYTEAEEHDSRRIARSIVKARPIRDTAHLATIVAGARKQWGRQRLHPATKTFLALRIAVNREMEELGQFLSRVPATLSQGGRWVMLSYHSLEDRPVKQCFQRLAHEGVLKILTKKVIQASDAEIAANPRARSVKMRAAEKIDPNQSGMPQEEEWLQ